MNAPRAIEPPVKRMLSRVEAAAYCGVSPSTFDKMVKDGLIPSPLKIYARNLFDRHKLDAALNALSGDACVMTEAENNDWD